MFKVFEELKMYTYTEVETLYPDSMFILTDVMDINSIQGNLVAISTDRTSYRDICIKKSELEDSGVPCLLAGSYTSGGVIGVLYCSKQEKE